MHRVNRSVPWKEQAKAGLAPDLTVRDARKGAWAAFLFDPLSVFSVQLRTALLDEQVEPSPELADEREIFRTARHRQRSMRCLPEP